MSNTLKLTVPEGLPFIDFEREFDFPVAEVFRAHKEPGLIARWLGPRGTQIKIDHYDFRTGGSYLYRHTGPDGNSYAFSGVFHTVRENEFAIQTFEFDGYPDVVSIKFMTFEDLGAGRARPRGHAVYPSMEAGTAWRSPGWRVACRRATNGSRSFSARPSRAATPRTRHRREHRADTSGPENFPFVDYEREFDFPATEVFRAHSDPALFQQWIGPRELTSRVEDFGMESGMAAGYEQLEELMGKLLGK